jgi:hypothetical protein
MTQVYSYMRWSMDRQSGGSTEERQRASQEAFCRHHGMTLAEELTDPGMSSFRGKNAHEGKLREIIDRAKRGDIPPGSLLLFENADRMTRMGLSDAVPLFFEILRAGLKIGIADRFQIYTPGTLDLGGLMTILVDMERANRESQRKSDFSRTGWKKNHLKMEAGEVVTDKAPQWLEVIDKQFVIREEIAAQIRALFAASLQYGVAESCRRVNAEHGSSWKVHQVQYLLKNRRLIGEHTITNYSEQAGKNVATDRVLPNYYPVIIDPNQFAEVQKVIASRKPFAGKQDASNLNIYRGLVQCMECGGSVRFMMKNKKEYFLCTNSMSNACKTPGSRSIRGELLRRLLFKFEHWTNLRSYFNESNDDLKTLRREHDNLTAQIERINTRTAQTQARLLDTDDQDMQDSLYSMLATIKGQERSAREQLTAIDDQISQWESADSLAGSDVGTRVEWMLYDRSEEAILERARINRYLTSIFNKLVIDFPGKKLHTEVKETFKGKVSELVATISVPHDNRFKAKPTGTIRISGTGKWRGPVTEEFTDEEITILGSIPAVVVEPIQSKATLEHIAAKLKKDAGE